MSPPRRIKLPSGINACSPRRTAQISTRVWYFFCRSIRRMPSSIESSRRRNSAISKFRPEKYSIFTAEGTLRILNSSCAVSSSGLMDIERFSCLRIKPRERSLYSGLRTLAMVCLAPILRAKKQHSIFISSEPVAATTSSALSTAASSRVSQSAPLPQTPITSYILVICSRTWASFSSATTSCPSADRLSTKVEPILPQPTTIIFILFPHLIRFSRITNLYCPKSYHFHTGFAIYLC